MFLARQLLRAEVSIDFTACADVHTLSSERKNAAKEYRTRSCSCRVEKGEGAGTRDDYGRSVFYAQIEIASACIEAVHMSG